MIITDWDDAYQVGAYIEGGERYVELWCDRAQAFRGALALGRQKLGVSYGVSADEALDLFLPEATPKGLFMFIHGGYWRANSRQMWSHMAAGPLARGWAVAVPGYTLCPAVSIAEITRQISRAVSVAADMVAGPIHLSGHSAGGHLAARMGCRGVDLAVAGRIARVVSISGVHDLRPLIRTAMNDDLRLDMASAVAESPALQLPRAGVDLTCWVGTEERPEFLRQNRLLANIWTGFGVETRAVEAAGHNHFTVIAELSDPDSALTAAVVG